MKRALLLVAGLVVLTAPVFALAAPGDLRYIIRNDDDSADVQQAMPGSATSSPRFIGGRPGQDHLNWYYPGPEFIVTSTSTPYGNELAGAGWDVRLGNIPMSSVTGLENTFLGKVSNATYEVDQAAIAAELASLASTTADWNATSGPSFIANKPEIPPAPKAYQGTSPRTGAFPVFKNATVSSGTAVFHLTGDGLSSGDFLCPVNVIVDSIDVEVNDAVASYQMSYALSNGNKTVTVTANKLTTANILTGILGQSQANGSVVRLVAWCY